MITHTAAVPSGYGYILTRTAYLASPLPISKISLAAEERRSHSYHARHVHVRETRGKRFEDFAFTNILFNSSLEVSVPEGNPHHTIVLVGDQSRLSDS